MSEQPSLAARSVLVEPEERALLERMLKQSDLGFSGMGYDGRRLVRTLIERYDEAGPVEYEVVDESGKRAR